LILIPIKDFSETKSRIKEAIPTEYSPFIDRLVELTFFRTIETVKSFSCPFGIISPSTTVINESEKLGATFTYCDSGIDLNVALSEAVQELPLEQAILIILPDLPFISQVFFHQLLNEAKECDMLIVPSISSDKNLGTAVLYLKKRTLVSFQFGRNSCERYQVEARKKDIKFRLLTFDPFARDLDTLNDVKYLKRHLKSITNPEPFKKILEQLNLIALL
jgi:2-phospho-L-lactate guanylyltransferase